jgi:hypothetical protein
MLRRRRAGPLRPTDGARGRNLPARRQSCVQRGWARRLQDPEDLTVYCNLFAA